MAASPLGMLAARREALVAQLGIVYRVPEWDEPRVYVKFRPLAHEELKAAAGRIERAKNKAAAELDANVALLVKACEEVWGDYGDGEKTPLRADPDAGLTRIDGALGQALGLPEGALASQVAKALFLREGDILSCAQHLAVQSGYQEAEADEALAGE